MTKYAYLLNLFIGEIKVAATENMFRYVSLVNI